MILRRLIHISDLHISKNIKSVLQNGSFLNKWIESLKKIEEIDTLIISGDIVDRGGSPEDYRVAETLLKQVIKELEIKHLICVPGNHDVSRSKLIGIKDEDEIDADNLWKYYDVKLKFYWDFIKNMGENVDKNAAIICYKVLDNPNMIVLGLNSTDRIGIEDGEGYINIERLRDDLKNILGDKNENYKGYTRIVVLHHRPIVYESASQKYTDNNSSKVGQYGTCNSQNWKVVKELLIKYDIHIVLTGHVHGTQSGQIRDYNRINDEIYYSTVGSIGVDFNRELKELLGDNIETELSKKLDKLQCYISMNGNHNAYNILTFAEGRLIEEEQFKFIVDEGEWHWISWKIKKFMEDNEQCDLEEENIFDTVPEEMAEDKRIEVDYGKELLKIMKDRKLYRTGHFHWKGSARLNWIDMSYFFQHRETMRLIIQAICQLFEREKELKNADTIVGLGIKGSIMLSYVRFLFPEKQCTYFPENKKEYNKYEWGILNDKKMHSIVVLTDVVHSGETVKTFIKNIPEKICDDARVNVVTIFDTTSDHNISDLEGIASIKMFSLAELKVIDCYGGCENCKIYTEKLAYVYEYKED